MPRHQAGEGFWPSLLPGEQDCRRGPPAQICSFTKRDLIYRISAFQRVYLETLAMYDWHTKWAFRLNDNTGKIYEIDETVMGAITDGPNCIAMLYRAGVPGWYV